MSAAAGPDAPAQIATSSGMQPPPSWWVSRRLTSKAIPSRRGTFAASPKRPHNLRRTLRPGRRAWRPAQRSPYSLALPAPQARRRVLHARGEPPCKEELPWRHGRAPSTLEAAEPVWPAETPCLHPLAHSRRRAIARSARCQGIVQGRQVPPRAQRAPGAPVPPGARSAASPLSSWGAAPRWWRRCCAVGYGLRCERRTVRRATPPWNARDEHRTLWARRRPPPSRGELRYHI